MRSASFCSRSYAICFNRICSSSGFFLMIFLTAVFKSILFKWLTTLMSSFYWAFSTFSTLNLTIDGSIRPCLYLVWAYSLRSPRYSNHSVRLIRPSLLTSMCSIKIASLFLETLIFLAIASTSSRSRWPLESESKKLN